MLLQRNICALESFHKRAVRRITRCHIYKDAEGNWCYPDHDTLMQKCRLSPIMTYVKLHCGTLLQYFEGVKTDLLSEVHNLKLLPRDAH